LNESVPGCQQCIVDARRRIGHSFPISEDDGANAAGQVALRADEPHTSSPMQCSSAK
jgi:hypothetical protein